MPTFVKSHRRGQSIVKAYTRAHATESKMFSHMSRRGAFKMGSFSKVVSKRSEAQMGIQKKYAVQMFSSPGRTAHFTNTRLYMKLKYGAYGGMR